MIHTREQAITRYSAPQLDHSQQIFLPNPKLPLPKIPPMNSQQGPLQVPTYVLQSTSQSLQFHTLRMQLTYLSPNLCLHTQMKPFESMFRQIPTGFHSGDNASMPATAPSSSCSSFSLRFQVSSNPLQPPHNNCYLCSASGQNSKCLGVFSVFSPSSTTIRFTNVYKPQGYLQHFPFTFTGPHVPAKLSLTFK